MVLCNLFAVIDISTSYHFYYELSGMIRHKSFCFTNEIKANLFVNEGDNLYKLEEFSHGRGSFRSYGFGYGLSPVKTFENMHFWLYKSLRKADGSGVAKNTGFRCNA